MSPLFLLIKVLPRNLVSFLTGWLVRLNFPWPLKNPILKGFAKTFHINLDEAEKPIEAYKNIEDLFTRRLKKGKRKLASSSYSSPCDGVLSLTQNLEASDTDTVYQIKGHSYSLSDLLENGSWKAKFVSTLYLAPHNYHRVHAPVSGKILSIKHIPGDLWPVNPKFLHLVPRLFARNERLVFKLELASGGQAFLVMVGALNVGRITTPFQKELITNCFQKNGSTHNFSSPPQVQRGDEIGTFLMGSTVVLAFDEEALKGFSTLPKLVDSPLPVEMGQDLCQ